MKKKLAASSKLSVVGHLDSIVENCARGWAYAPSIPSERLVVNLFSQNILVGQGTANIFREDLVAAGIGDGHYSFKIPLSYELGNGQDHEVFAVVQQSSFELTGSPKIAKAWNAKNTENFVPRQEAKLEFEKVVYALLTHKKIKTGDNLLRAFELASLLQETMRLEEAKQAWEALQSHIGNYSILLIKQAETMLLSDQIEQALDFYMRTLTVELTSIWAQIGVVECYRKLKKYSESLDSLKAYLEINPNNQLLKNKFVETEKLLKPIDPAENKFFTKFANLGTLLWQAPPKPQLIKCHESSSNKASLQNNIARSLIKQLTIKEALEKAAELKNIISKI